MISAIAQQSMEMASAKLANETQVSVLKQAMDTQKESMALLLEAFGLGQKTDVQG